MASDFPPNPKQWPYERHAMDLRGRLQLGPDERLPVRGSYSRFQHVTIQPHGDSGCAQVYIDGFRGALRETWSACALPVGEEVVVLFNDSHSPERTRASLMEEYFHLQLGHPLTTIRVHNGGATRSFTSAVEEAAYHSGAAALLPYRGLRNAIDEGLDVASIARRYQVSRPLVEFRAKVTRQYPRLMRSQRYAKFARG